MKLVDADALKGEFDPKLFGLSVIYRAIDNAPDASQPLRERVAKLEAGLERLLKISEDILFSDPYSSDLEELDSAQEQAKALLKESDHA